MAIWVELTGNPNVVAIKTVIADDNASGGYLDITFLPLDDQDKELIF